MLQGIEYKDTDAQVKGSEHLQEFDAVFLNVEGFGSEHRKP